MLLLNNNELQHVDSSSDILEHYGVKGMKWGKRLRSTVDNIKSFPSKVYNNHVENLRYKYRTEGMTEPEVENVLRKRLRNEKIAAAVIGTAVTAYAGKKGFDYAQDEWLGRTLNKGTTVNTIGTQNSMDYARRFYASKGDDTRVYKNIHGFAVNARTGQQPNLIKSRLTENAKIAPNSVARKEFFKLYNRDKNVRDAVDDIRNFALDGQKIGKYDAFNRIAPLMDSDEKGNPWRSYQNRLIKKGFAGIQDVNDKKFSSYKTKNPMILFNVKAVKDSVTPLSVSYKKAMKTEYSQMAKPIIEKTLTKGAMGLAAIGGVMTTTTGYNNTKERTSDNRYNKKYNTSNQ